MSPGPRFVCSVRRFVQFPICAAPRGVGWGRPEFSRWFPKVEPVDTILCTSSMQLAAIFKPNACNPGWLELCPDSGHSSTRISCISWFLNVFVFFIMFHGLCCFCLVWNQNQTLLRELHESCLPIKVKGFQGSSGTSGQNRSAQSYSTLGTQRCSWGNKHRTRCLVAIAKRSRKPACYDDSQHAGL